MTETIAVRPAEAVGSAGPPMVWGLNAGQLLDAFWRGQGVHVVRRGEGGYVDRSAEFSDTTEMELGTGIICNQNSSLTTSCTMRGSVLVATMRPNEGLLMS